MRRIRIAGLCLVAVLALSAIGAGSASALPEVGRCVSVAAGTGKYTTGNCTTKKAKSNFEWKKNAVKNKFTASFSASFMGIPGRGVLEETAPGLRITCETESVTGEYYQRGTSTKEVKNVIAKFNGCELPAFASSCQNAASGEIVTSKLKGPLGYISGEKTPTPVVGQELTPERAKGPLAEYECAGRAVILRLGPGRYPYSGHDCIIAPLSEANTMSTNIMETYSGAKGVQSPQHFQKTPTKICNLESETNDGANERVDLSGETGEFGEHGEKLYSGTGAPLETIITSEEALEIKV